MHCVQRVDAVIEEPMGAALASPSRATTAKFDMVSPNTMAGTCSICLHGLASSKEGVFVTLCNHVFCCGLSLKQFLLPL